MQISVKQDRQKWIGGSDIPAIMGISPFTTRYELLLYKAGIKDIEFSGNEYTEYGNIMEPKIRTYINEEINMEEEFVETKHINEEFGYRCHLDGENEDCVLEIKTTSQIHDKIEDYKIYLVQLLFYIMNVNKEKGILAVYERPEDFSKIFDENRLTIYEINIKDYGDLVEEINNALAQFKIDLAKLKENPLLSEEDLLPTPIQEISKELEIIENQIELYKDLEKQEKELKSQLFEAMNKYHIKKWETPNGTLITRVDSTPDKTEMVFNEDRFKEEQAILYTSYCEEKVKKGKSGYVRITLGGKNED